MDALGVPVLHFPFTYLFGVYVILLLILLS